VHSHVLVAVGVSHTVNIYCYRRSPVGESVCARTSGTNLSPAPGARFVELYTTTAIVRVAREGVARKVRLRVVCIQMGPYADP
jgi:hypothetical protein